MKLTKDHLLTLRETAISAARQAGQLIANYDKSSLQVKRKEEGGTSLASQVVTEVDLKAQDKILEILNPSLEEYDLALLTEESVDDKSRFEKDYFWCIDPIDGTLPYIESTPGYSVSIGLVSKEGIPCLGVIYDPVEHKCYSAIKDCGAFCDGEPFRVNTNSQEKFTLVNDRGLKKHARFQEILEKMKPMKQRLLHGGCAMNAIYVIQNAPAALFKFPKKEDGGGSLWDYAAGACIVKEAGGFTCDILIGDQLDLNRVDSTFMNHRGAIVATSQELADEIRQKFGFSNKNDDS